MTWLNLQQNSYNSPNVGNENPRVPAVAAMITGDKNSFYRCGFSGVQDTLWDDQGRHYFNHCTIEGAVDFIFGAGQSIYQVYIISKIGNFKFRIKYMLIYVYKIC